VTRVAIVAPTTAARTRLESLVSESASLTATAAAASIDAIARDPRLASSEVVLLYSMTPDLIARDLEALPPIPIVVLLRGPPSADAIPSLLAAGVRGVLPEDSTAEEIAAAIEAAAAGFVILPPEQVGELLASRPAATHDFAPSRAEAARSPALTPREREILAMLAEGLPNKSIAARLGISDHTVKTHLEAIFDKLGASTRAEAVARGVRMGLLLM
jgi:DNA-binding NarL/FixJ family response regulator